VAGAYANDPLFRGLTGGAKQSGFLAFARVNGDGVDSAHLELDLGSGLAPSFFPLTFADTPRQEALATLLQSIDVRTVAADALIERQFGPMLRMLEQRPSAAVETTDVGLPGAFDETDALALVIGGDAQLGDALHLFPLLATDPFARTLPIVVAAPADTLATLAGELRRLASFYRLSLRLVPMSAGDDVLDALEAGAAATQAGTLALLSAHLLPASPGWLRALVTAHRLKGGRFVVCPTILFDDGSVRWAGIHLDEIGGKREFNNQYLGYPRSILSGAVLEEVAAGTVECCVISRASLEAAGGFRHAYLGLAAKNLDMALRVRLAGTPALWHPGAEMVAAEERGPSAGSALTRRVDQWAFDHRWALALANLRS